MAKNIIEIMTEEGSLDRKGKRIFKADAEESIKMVFDAIKTAIKNGEEVQISGFGTFKPVVKKGRKWSLPLKDEDGVLTGEFKSGVSPDKSSMSFGISKAFELSLS